MLRLFICSLLLAAGHLSAQTTESFPLDGASALHLSANFGDVEITTGTGSEVTVRHLVLINGEPHPELAGLKTTNRGGTLTISETNPTKEQLEPEWRKKMTKFSNDDIQEIKVKLLVTVPAGVKVSVETVYGGVEITDVAGLTEVKATYGAVTVKMPPRGTSGELNLYSNYGAVDLAVPTGRGLDLDLTTEYGELLTDLEIDISTTDSEKRDFYERVVGTFAGGGARVRCKSPYSNVYLRAR